MATFFNTCLYKIIPFLIFTALIIAGTIVLSYTIYLSQPVPVHFAITIIVCVAGLILIWAAIYLSKSVWRRNFDLLANKDIEGRLIRSPRPGMVDRTGDGEFSEPSQKPIAIPHPLPIHSSNKLRQPHDAGLGTDGNFALPGEFIEPFRWIGDRCSFRRNLSHGKNKQNLEMSPVFNPSSLSELPQRTSSKHWARQATTGLDRSLYLDKELPRLLADPKSPQTAHYPFSSRPSSLPESLRSGYRPAPILDPVPRRPRRLSKPPSGSTTPREGVEIRFPDPQIPQRSPSYKRL
ncbi:hypothetical protein MMC06_003410, partial [Schaereria dolodes]|nr:hypothetical protein [Schaereria dolodes]